MSLFWGQATAEPKRQFRFELSFTRRNGNSSGDIPVWSVKTATKPVAEVSTITHQYIDHTFNFPGRVTWQPITVTLVDPVSPDLSFAFLDVLGAGGYKYPDTSDIAKKSLSKKAFTETIGNVKLKQIDADNKIIEEWILVAPSHMSQMRWWRYNAQLLTIGQSFLRPQEVTDHQLLLVANLTAKN